MRWVAVSLLAEFLEDKSDILPILKEIAQSDEADLVRKMAIEKLAQGWKDDPEIQAFLQGLSSGSERQASSPLAEGE